MKILFGFLRLSCTIFGIVTLLPLLMLDFELTNFIAGLFLLLMGVFSNRKLKAIRKKEQQLEEEKKKEAKLQKEKETEKRKKRLEEEKIKAEEENKKKREAEQKKKKEIERKKRLEEEKRKAEEENKKKREVEQKKKKEIERKKRLEEEKKEEQIRIENNSYYYEIEVNNKKVVKGPFTKEEINNLLNKNEISLLTKVKLGLHTKSLKQLKKFPEFISGFEDFL